MKFRKKSKIVEANQFEHPATAPIGVKTREDGSAYITTIQGEDVNVKPGEWIVLEDPPGDGTRAYPVAPDVFEANFEREYDFGDVPNRRNFEDELTCLLNKYSKENRSNTPDFILAAFLTQCLEAWNATVQARELWYGRKFSEGSVNAAPMPITLHEDGTIERMDEP